MNVVYTRLFEKQVKKLHAGQKKGVEEAIAQLQADPGIGELKRADLRGVRIYKFHLLKQLMLIAYVLKEDTITLTIVMMGTHENFYRDLKNYLH